MTTGPDLRIMLTGDVMLGRGINQILPYPSPAALHERCARSALLYVSLVEKRNGAVPLSVAHDYVWGDLLADLAVRTTDARIVNLQTAVTRAETPAQKGICYRMNPAGLAVLRPLAIDCCVLANNHALDWEREGLLETLDARASAVVKTAGAGHDDFEARAPAILPIFSKGRVLVHGLADASSGFPHHWAAGPGRPGVHVLADRSDAAIGKIAAQVVREKRPGDVVFASGSDSAHSLRLFPAPQGPAPLAHSSGQDEIR